MWRVKTHVTRQATSRNPSHLNSTRDKFGSRSRRFVQILQSRMESLILLWLFVFGGATALRIGLAPLPIRSTTDLAQMLLLYGVIALAPIAGYRLAMTACPANPLPEPTRIRFALFGRWRQLDLLDARKHPAFGPFGIMASLLVGLLLNVPVRSAEFLFAVPAMNHDSPNWAMTILYMMAFDAITMNFVYAVCFVMALRSIPLFPRTLLFAWALDLLLQVTIAHQVAEAANLPAPVAYALGELLSDNVTKVLISVAIWVPYLLLSERVNVTYRSRISAD